MNQSRFEETRRARWSRLIFSQLARQCYMGNSRNHEHEEIEKDTICCMRRRGRYIFAKIYLVRDGSVITVISSYLTILNSKVIQQYQIELLGTEIDLSDTNQKRGRLIRPKHHTYKDYLSKLKTEPEGIRSSRHQEVSPPTNSPPTRHQAKSPRHQAKSPRHQP